MRTIFVCALYSIKYGTFVLLRSLFGQGALLKEGSRLFELVFCRKSEKQRRYINIQKRETEKRKREKQRKEINKETNTRNKQTKERDTKTGKREKWRKEAVKEEHRL